MQDLKDAPWAKLYDDEARFWPWGLALKAAAEEIACRAPENGTVHDWMCGTGNLLRYVHVLRPDLHLTGIDANPHFIAFAKNQSHAQIKFIEDDITQYAPTRCDLAVSTGSLHHLQEDVRSHVLNNMWDSLAEGGRLIILDEILPAYTESDRDLAVRLLYSHYASWTKRNPMPAEQYAEVWRLFECDLLEENEWKYDLGRLQNIMPVEFESRNVIWPKVRDYGDMLLVTKPKSKIAVNTLNATL